MAKPPMRPGVLSRLATNFWNSLRYGRHMDQKSVVIGEDIFGNRYHEIPADPRRGRRRGRRWYTNAISNHNDPRDHSTVAGFDKDIPSEWESWLRFRRDAPPTEQQVLQSLALADLKKVPTGFSKLLGSILVHTPVTTYIVDSFSMTSFQ